MNLDFLSGLAGLTSGINTGISSAQQRLEENRRARVMEALRAREVATGEHAETTHATQVGNEFNLGQGQLGLGQNRLAFDTRMGEGDLNLRTKQFDSEYGDHGGTDILGFHIPGSLAQQKNYIPLLSQELQNRGEMNRTGMELRFRGDHPDLYGGTKTPRTPEEAHTMLLEKLFGTPMQLGEHAGSRSDLFNEAVRLGQQTNPQVWGQPEEPEYKKFLDSIANDQRFTTRESGHQTLNQMISSDPTARAKWASMSDADKAIIYSHIQSLPSIHDLPKSYGPPMSMGSRTDYLPGRDESNSAPAWPGTRPGYVLH